MSTRERGIFGLHVAVLWAYAVAQPLYALLGENPEFFAVRNSPPGDILLLCFILSAAFPVVLWLPWFCSGLISRVLSQVLQFAILVALSAAAVLSMVRPVLLPRSPASEIIVAVCCMTAGIFFAVMYRRSRLLRSFLTYLSPCIVVFPLFFLLEGRIQTLVFPKPVKSAPSAMAAPKHPIVLVVFDELSLPLLLSKETSIAQDLFPSFHRLSRTSHWFVNATTVSNSTSFVLPALLSGSFPKINALPIFADYPRNIFSLLGKSMDIRALEPVTSLCPVDICGKGKGIAAAGPRLVSLVDDIAIVYAYRILPPRVRKRLPSIQARWGHFRAVQPNPFETDVTKLPPATVAARFLDLIAPGEFKRPPFLFLHLGLPHYPWRYLPSGREYGDPLVVEGQVGHELWGDDKYLVAQAFERYLLQAQYADRVLGQILEKLEQTGLFHQSLLVVTADHGVSFRCNASRRTLSEANRNDFLPVPLFVKEPYQTSAAVRHDFIQLTDVLPSLASLNNIKLPWPTDGVSFFPASIARHKLRFVAQTGDLWLDPQTVSLPEALRHLKALKAVLSESSPAKPLPTLLGAVPGNFPIRQAQEETVVIEGSAAFRAVGNGEIPAYLRGDILCPQRCPNGLGAAVALNGAISKVVPLAMIGEKTVRLRAMLPESGFRVGDNHLEIFRVSEENEQIVLIRLPERLSDDYLLKDGELYAGNSLFPASPGIVGHVDAIDRIAGGIRLAGWAFDRAADRFVDEIVVMRGSRYVLSARTGRKREDLARYLANESADQSGFEVSFSSAREEDIKNFRIFAVSQGKQRELTW